MAMSMTSIVLGLSIISLVSGVDKCDLRTTSQKCLEPTMEMMHFYRSGFGKQGNHLSGLVDQMNDLCSELENGVKCIERAAAKCTEFLHYDNERTLENYLKVLSSEGILTMCSDDHLAMAYEEHGMCVIENSYKGEICLKIAKQKVSDTNSPTTDEFSAGSYNSKSEYCSILKGLFLCLMDFLGPYCGREGVSLYVSIMTDFLPTGNFGHCLHPSETIDSEEDTAVRRIIQVTPAVTTPNIQLVAMPSAGKEGKMQPLAFLWMLLNAIAVTWLI